jgi:hypothetical protein
MIHFEPGQAIGIPCDATQGAFPGECLVSFESKTGPVSGFVPAENIERFGSETYLRGVIKEVSEDTLTVWVQGSFFTTTGLAYLSRDTHLHCVAA